MDRSLLDVPFEIQGLIYRFYFNGPHPPIRLTWQDWRKPLVVRVADSKSHFALLRTCRSVYRTAIRHIDSTRLTIDARDFLYHYSIQGYRENFPALVSLFRYCTKLLVPEANVSWSIDLPRVEQLEIFCWTEKQVSVELENAVEHYFEGPRVSLHDRRLVSSVLNSLTEERARRLDFGVPSHVEKEVVIPYVMAMSLVDQRLGPLWITMSLELRIPDARASLGRIAAKRIDSWPRHNYESEIEKGLVKELRNMVWYRNDDLESKNPGTHQAPQPAWLKKIDLDEFIGKWVTEDHLFATYKAIDERRARNLFVRSASTKSTLSANTLSDSDGRSSAMIDDDDDDDFGFGF